MNNKLISFVISILIIYLSCKKEPNMTLSDPTVNKEFIADNSTFKDYLQWNRLVERTGPDASLGIFHNVDVPNLIRRVYVKDNALPSNGQYPVGTIIVKEYRKADGTLSDFDQLAMVKREGKNFNTAFNGWEWFRLDHTSLNIAVIDGVTIRGSILGNNVCNNCHLLVKSKDFVFTGLLGNNPDNVIKFVHNLLYEYERFNNKKYQLKG